MPKRSRLSLQLAFTLSAITMLAASVAAQEVFNFLPVTRDMLQNPDPAHWLMFSGTYDAPRYSPLTQINKENGKELRMGCSRGMDQACVASSPLVYDGIMYVLAPSVMQLMAVNILR